MGGLSFDIKKVTGIYAIEVPALNKVYVGQTVDVSNRLRQHKSVLRRGLCKNKELQADWDSIPENFEFKLLERCYNKDLKKRETERTRQYVREGWYVYNVCIVSDTTITNIPIEHKDFVIKLLKFIDSGLISKDSILSLLPSQIRA